MRVLITGVTGLIGRRTAEVLSEAGHELWGVSRSKGKGAGPVQRWITWDPAAGLAPPGAFEGVQAVIHLAGEPIAEGRWSEDRKRRIRLSRIEGTHNLVESLRAQSARPNVLVAGSAVGFYGDRKDELLDETSTAGTGFLPEVVQAWEAEAARASELKIRVVQLRTGVVLARDGGALSKMLLPFKLGVGGRLGNGKQWFPWIHLEDEVGLITLALDNPKAFGPLNAVAPGAATNQSFTEALGRAVHRPTVLPVPVFGLKIAFGEMSSALLGSQRVVPLKAQQLGYRFRFPDLASALAQCLAP